MVGFGTTIRRYDRHSFAFFVEVARQTLHPGEVSIAVDESRLPFLIIRYVGKHTDAEYNAYYERLGEVLERLLRDDTRHVTIVDARQAGMPTSRQARFEATWMKNTQGKYDRISLGSALIITSPLIRGALKAVLWMQPMTTAHVVVQTVEEAEQWARDKLTEAGIRVPKNLHLDAAFDDAM